MNTLFMQYLVDNTIFDETSLISEIENPEKGNLNKLSSVLKTPIFILIIIAILDFFIMNSLYSKWPYHQIPFNKYCIINI